MLLRWLIALALLVALLAMAGDGRAAAHGGPVAAGHCAGEQPPAEAPAAPIDCMIACAGCLPAQGGLLAARPLPAAAAEAAPVAFRLRGLHPEAAIPPPRLS